MNHSLSIYPLGWTDRDLTAASLANGTSFEKQKVFDKTGLGIIKIKYFKNDR